MLRLQLEEILLHDCVLPGCWDARATKVLWHKAALGKCLLPCLLWVQGALGEPWVAFAAQLAVYHCGVMERGEADKGDVRNCADKFALGFGGQPLCGRCSFHMASVFALKGFVWICFQCPS